ncbi:hypothetical protein [Nonomuraea cavernae]|uniref:HEAT repeat domain-containing protein n=1 Tax=Nonomuraea cavernae TaxID=2045107 RepID=A0A918DFR4_9ACTN|nr:hypothetical protein [Nonomuraea cavernae]MCA2184267.1 hypothetical protein [Nonomuraea cavernae]GGO64328.1 hypothetical protein GCM10012289_13490 [Nonomuraea cavernae]
MHELTGSAGELLDEMESLPFQERRHRLHHHGRRLAGRPELRGMLDELAERGPYERHTALTLAAAAGETAHVVRATRDPDPDVAGYAITLTVRLGLPAEVIERIVREGSTQARSTAYRAIRRHGRSDLAERLLGQVRERWGEREAARLLVACRPEVVAAELDGLAHAVRNWASLGRRHPLAVLAHAENVLPELPHHLRNDWWRGHAAGVEAAAPAAPERVIALLEPYWTPVLSARCVARLLEADPGRTLALFLVSGRAGWLRSLLRSRAVRDRLGALADAELGEMGRVVREDDQGSADDLLSALSDAGVGLVAAVAGEGDEGLADLLRALPPSRREAVFDAATAGTDLGRAELSGPLLEVLPLDRRSAEARRMARLRPVAQSPSRLLETTGFLPYGEAEPALRAATRRSNGSDRALGYRHLIACAGRSRDPEVITALLESLGRLRNEQDPVRLAAVEALAAIPAGLFVPAHLPALEQVVDGALAARDRSGGTDYALTGLAGQVLRSGAAQDEADLLEFALRTLARLTRHTGRIHLSRLSGVLSPGQAAALVDRVAPFLAAEAGHDRHELTFLLAGALGRRGHAIPELRRALARALTSASEGSVRTAVAHWLAPPRTRGERVPGLLAMDPSMVTLREVFQAIAWHRTDLLDAALGEQPPRGRFTQTGLRRVWYVSRAAARRWTARQREACLRLLHRIADDAELPGHERAMAIEIIGRIPAVPSGELDRYLNSPDDLTRRAALTALPWTGHPRDALTLLLDRAYGDDAHVAVSAAAGAARSVPPGELTTALTPILAAGKVTARKEAVRLLAGHRAPDTASLLRRLWDGAGPDVRTAIASACRELLDDPAAWSLLADVVAGGGDPAAPVLGAHPLDLPGRFRGRYAELVVAAAESDDPVTRRAAVGALDGWARYTPAAVDRLAGIAGDLTRTADWRVAARGLVRCARSGTGVAELRATVRALAAAPGEPDAGADRDRPAAQRLAAIAGALRERRSSGWAVEQDTLDEWLPIGGEAVERGVLYERRSPGGEAVEPVVRQVAGDFPAHLEAELVAASVDWADPRAQLAALVDGAAGVLVAVDAGRVLAGSASGVDPGRILPHAAWLAGRNETGALLAIALAARCGPLSGWAEPWRDLVRRVRNGPWGEAAHLASSVHTADE